MRSTLEVKRCLSPFRSRRISSSSWLVRLLREELQLLHEPGSYVGEVVKVMGKKKVLVKVQPEGKYSTSTSLRSCPSLTADGSRRL